jgi:Holliday junction resolvase-like predicted endonuclease
MKNSNAKVGAEGERLVATELQKHGFRTHTDTKQSGSTDIIAEREDRRLRVQVKSSTSSYPSNPTPQEITNINNVATGEGSEPWLARVSNLRPGESLSITWDELQQFR